MGLFQFMDGLYESKDISTKRKNTVGFGAPDGKTCHHKKRDVRSPVLREWPGTPHMSLVMRLNEHVLYIYIYIFVCV